MNWHQLNIQQCFERLNSNDKGLSNRTAEEKKAEFGLNKLEEKKKISPVVMFLAQFKDVMILILVAAAVVSAVIGDLKDAVVILFIIALNAVIGFVQEYRAEKAMDALKKMASSSARVLRDGRTVQLPAEEIVPGDVVLLEAGDMIPADLRLLDVHGLKVEEASLTGESHAVDKNTGEISEKETALGDRINMAYKSTLVTNGRGKGLVVATGMQTEIGAIAEMLQEKSSMTPLQARLADFAKKLSVIVLGICVLLYVFGLLRGEDPVRMLLTAISVAVAAIPEALPAVITIALAFGAKKLVSVNALVRKLPAVETLGSVTFICSDKTGTLTQNKMTVQQTWVDENLPPNFAGFSKEELLLYSMAANQDTRENEEGKVMGDPTEVALVEFAANESHFKKEWLQEYRRVHEIPFDADRKLMTTVHQQAGGKFLVITKGALESIQKICSEDAAAFGAGHRKAEALAGEGQRVLAYAIKELDSLPADAALEKDLRFLGLAGMIDPPRQEAKQAVKECRTAGIVPVMITGDHPTTAKVIARELGILQVDSDRVVTGLELARMQKEEFEENVCRIKVYARVSPEQKLMIVKTLQARRQFVAMTGDGVNDAPALKRANIGIAMGITGTDVSKEAAHMILLDDNFATIVKAVKEGRRIFDNIRKFIKYTMTSNAGEIWTILLAPVLGLPIPLLPIHILWINLVTDGLPGLALASEPAEKNLMERSPRPTNESIFAGGLGVHVLWVGILMAAVCLGIQAWALQVGNTKWQTMVFTVLCLSQMGHVLAIRSDNRYLFQQGLLSNKPLLGAVLLTFLLQILLIYVPAFNEIFRTEPLNVYELSLCLAASAIVFIGVEIEKFIRNRRKTKELSDHRHR
jgi:Ca2+-transporting ATPase